MNAFRIDGQRAVITGGGSGLGFGIAKVFIEAGAEVIIIGRNEEKLRGAQQQLGERCSYRAFDVTQLDKIPALVEEIGTVDILVNCAGTHLKKWALDVTDAEFLDVMNVHVTSVFALSREFARLMVERGKGSIILNQFDGSSYGLGADSGLYHRQDSCSRSAAQSRGRTFAQRHSHQYHSTWMD